MTVLINLSVVVLRIRRPELPRAYRAPCFPLPQLLASLGIFVAIAWGGWADMITSFRIGEFEGEGALRVPVYPTRAIIFAMSVLSILCYIQLIIRLLGGARLSSYAEPQEQEI